MLKNSFKRHTRESGYPENPTNSWIPSFAGMTNTSNLRQTLLLSLRMSARHRHATAKTANSRGRDTTGAWNCGGFYRTASFALSKTISLPSPGISTPAHPY